MKITIVTPSLNQGNFIEETINSVINQKGNFELEYIIMDAVSTDNTLEIIKKYDQFINSKNFIPGCKKLTFKWFSEKDSGQSEAINKGFKMATGEIINWLCADDLLAEDALQTVADFFDRNNDVAVFGGSLVIDEAGRIINYQNGRAFTREELIRLDIAYNDFFIPQPSTFLRKKIIEDIGLLDESLHLCMDYKWYLEINKKYKFYYLDKILSSTRYHKDCKTAKFEQQNYKVALRVSKEYRHELCAKSRISYFLNYNLIKINRRLGKLNLPVRLRLGRIYWQAPQNPEKNIKIWVIFSTLAVSFVFFVLWKLNGISFLYWIFFLFSGVCAMVILELYFRIQHNIDSLKEEIKKIKNGR